MRFHPDGIASITYTCLDCNRTFKSDHYPKDCKHENEQEMWFWEGGVLHDEPPMNGS